MWTKLLNSRFNVGKFHLHDHSARIIQVVLLLVMFWAMLHSVQNTSPTYDEHEYIARGYTFLKTGDTHLQLRHPILLDTIASLPLLLLPEIKLPLDHPSLAAGDFHVYARVFLWEVNEAIADKIVFWARLPNMLLTLVLVTAVFQWTRTQFGLKAGLLAMTVAVLDPNLLAHGRLVTPDVGQTTFIFLSVLSWWRFLQKQTWLRLLLAGGVLGLAQTAGFPALIVYPVIGLITAVHGWRQDRLQRWLLLSGALMAVGFVSLFMIWAVYRFTWGPVWPDGFSVPAPYHWQEMQSLFQRLDRQDLAYLNGEVYRGGKLLFFVVAWFIKTPIPLILLLISGIVYLFARRKMMQHIALWLLPVLYYGNALTTDLNIGYRHILPILPFVHVLAGTAVLWGVANWQRLARVGAVLWLLVGTVAIFPYFLTYFNELVGGPEQGRHHLVVSDLDWGQDLPALGKYLRERDIDEVFLSWFGTASPEHYGIRYRPLPAWPPRGNPEQYAFHPTYPLPGVYAISAANLQGARFENEQDTFSWFWQQQPEAIIGNSVYVYRVPQLLDEQAEPVNVLLTGAALAEIPDSVIEAQMQTNDMHPRWFNGQTAMVFPEGRTIWVRNTAVSTDPNVAQITAEIHPDLSFDNKRGETMQVYAQDMQAVIQPYLQANVQQHLFLEPLQSGASTQPDAIDVPVEVGSVVDFLGYQLLTDTVLPGQEVKIMTFWQIKQRLDLPLSIFVHLLAPDGSIVAQQDGFDVTAAALYPNDIVVQVHTLSVPSSVPEGTGWLALGMYRPDTLMRLPVTLPGRDRQEIDRLFVLIDSN